MLSTLDRYILKNTLLSFIGGTVVLTLIVWVTQVLREVDLVTSKGQSILLFLQIAGFLIPMLTLVILPIALFAAISQTLNKLAGDSELIVMTASGVSPLRIMRPFLILTTGVSAAVLFLALTLAPMSIRNLRILGNQAQTNIISVIVKPGKFIDLQAGLTFHIRERLAGGVLAGLLIADTRDKTLHMTYVAERGIIAEIDSGNFLVLENGTLQRRTVANGEVALVAFDKYAFDLTTFTQSEAVYFRPSERTLAELLTPDPKDRFYIQTPGRYTQEIHDRFSAPLYPFAFMMIALAFLGQAGTTRTSRTGAGVSAVFFMLTTKALSLGVSNLIVSQPHNYIYAYIFPLIVIVFFGGAALGFYKIMTSEELFKQLAFYIRKTPLKKYLAKKEVMT
jgi:lipopolysaccharide export system permease protein